MADCAHEFDALSDFCLHCRLSRAAVEDVGKPVSVDRWGRPHYAPSDELVEWLKELCGARGMSITEHDTAYIELQSGPGLVATVRRYMFDILTSHGIHEEGAVWPQGSLTVADAERQYRSYFMRWLERGGDVLHVRAWPSVELIDHRLHVYSRVCITGRPNGYGWLDDQRHDAQVHWDEVQARADKQHANSVAAATYQVERFADHPINKHADKSEAVARALRF